MIPKLTDRQKASLEKLAEGDHALYERFLKRFHLGEPIPYITGKLQFGERTFYSDRRAFITDPELTYLVATVIKEIDVFTEKHQRPPILAEFGFGGGAISISIKLERPKVPIFGVDIDPAALALGLKNCMLHKVHIETIESDFFQSWPADLPMPDIIFGDPPWGNETDLYDNERDADYYRYMPPASAFPPDGGRCSVHHNLLQNIKDKAWNSLVLLNVGVLPEDEVAQLQARCAESRIIPCNDSINILRSYLVLD